MSYCPDCGTKYSDGLCPNCHEELYIFETQICRDDDDMDIELSDEFVEKVQEQRELVKSIKKNEQVQP